MKTQNEPEIIRELEERLLQPSVRASEKDVSEILADDFIEYGSSGRIYDKKSVIEGFQSKDSTQRSLSDFMIKKLDTNTFLATYLAMKQETNGQKSYSLRSSIWKMIENRWQIIFHQGTPTNGKLST